MLKKTVLLASMLIATACFAAVDVNQASEAELDGIKGIGPSLSGKILEARKKGQFKDWSDLRQRVKGIGNKSAARLSEAGLNVNGAGFKPADAGPQSR